MPKRNEVVEHFVFFTRKLDSLKSFDKFYADLRSLIKSCDFEPSEEKLLSMQIVLCK